MFHDQWAIAGLWFAYAAEETLIGLLYRAELAPTFGHWSATTSTPDQAEPKPQPNAGAAPPPSDHQWRFASAFSEVKCSKSTTKKTCGSFSCLGFSPINLPNCKFYPGPWKSRSVHAGCLRAFAMASLARGMRQFAVLFRPGEFYRRCVLCPSQ